MGGVGWIGWGVGGGWRVGDGEGIGERWEGREYMEKIVGQ
jgi:hypothetical protein